MTLAVHEEDERCKLATDLCDLLDKAGISYGIIHGAEHYPARVGRDLDVIVPAADLQRATRVVRERAQELGWRSLVAPISWAGAPVVFWKADGPSFLSFELHFIDRVVWSGILLADFGTSTIHRPDGGLPLAVEAGFAKRVLTQILAGCWERMAERPAEVAIFDYERKQVPALLASIFGTGNVGRLSTAVEADDLSALKRLAGDLRRAAFRRALNPFSAPKASPRWLGEKLQRRAGHAGWYLPNLIILAQTKAEARAFLDAVTPLLSFSKALSLDSFQPGQGSPGETALRRHRGLFRYVALAESTDRETKLPEPEPDAGNLVISIHEHAGNITARAGLQLGKERREITATLDAGQLPVRMATWFFLAAEATAEGIGHFTER